MCLHAGQKEEAVMQAHCEEKRIESLAHTPRREYTQSETNRHQPRRICVNELIGAVRVDLLNGRRRVDTNIVHDLPVVLGRIFRVDQRSLLTIP